MQGGGRSRRATPKVERDKDLREGPTDQDQGEGTRHRGKDPVGVEMKARMGTVARATMEEPKTPGAPRPAILGCLGCQGGTAMEAAGATEAVTEGTEVDNSPRTPTATLMAMSMPQCLLRWSEAKSR